MSLHGRWGCALPSVGTQAWSFLHRDAFLSSASPNLRCLTWLAQTSFLKIFSGQLSETLHSPCGLTVLL